MPTILKKNRHNLKQTGVPIPISIFAKIYITPPQLTQPQLEVTRNLKHSYAYKETLGDQIAFTKDYPILQSHQTPF